MTNVNVIGAGFAGCEAAYQLAKRGVHVTLFEMKPKNIFQPIVAIIFANFVVQIHFVQKD